MLEIVGITRFALVNESLLTIHPLTRHQSIAEAQKTVFDPARMKARMLMFCGLALPSVLGMVRPAGVRLRYVVVTSAELPDCWKDRLRAVLSRDPVCSLLEIEAGDQVWPAVRRAVFEGLWPGDSVFTFRLDDDDVLSRDYLCRVAAWIEGGGRGVLSFDSGIYLARLGQVWRWGLRTVPNIAIGLGLLASPERPLTIYDRGNHVEIDRGNQVSRVVDQPMWIRTIHAHNSSGVSRFAGQQIGNDQVRLMLRRLFPHVDQEAAMEALAA